MIRRRIEWLLVVLAAAVLYLFDNGTATLALLAACICAPLFAWIFVTVSGKNLQITFTREDTEEAITPAAPETDEPVFSEIGRKGKRNRKKREKQFRREGRERRKLLKKNRNKIYDPFEQKTEEDDGTGYRIKLRITNPDIVPVSGVEAKVRCTNLRTGENEFIVINKSVPPKGISENTFTVKPSHAGRYEIAVDSVKLLDPLQIWGRNIKINDVIHITVMPELFDTALSIVSSAASMPESDRYMDGRNGNDPGEVHEIREYKPGDSIKNIHWKLSEKTDRMLVKILGIPVTDQFLVILDNAADVGLNPDALDAIASVFASVMNDLIDRMMPVTTGWTDPVTGIPVFHKIQNENELLAAADEYLSIPAVTKSAFEIIERGIIDSRFAHLIIVSSRIPQGLNSITNGCQVTILMYGSDISGRTDEGAEVIGFDELTYSTELPGIEV